MKILLVLPVIFCSFLGTAQSFVDTTFSINTEMNIVYGSAINFAGQETTLHMDISCPTNDTVPNCGRPLVLIIHGGAWLAGSKNESFIPSLRQDFAKRGYVAVAINYRLGFFQTDVPKNCNIPNWNCVNAADSVEWSRALYRGIQDAKGAIRYMIMNQVDYDIDPSNVYVIGESAGAFIALGVGYMDDESEKPADCGAIASVNAPHQNYYAPCIQGSAFDIPIAQMNLSRPDLGPVSGTMNATELPYFVRGVGSFYGGIYQDLFSVKNSVHTPVLYMFHQPNDLIVPVAYDRILKGFNDCAVATNCVNIDHRKMVYGSAAINNMVDTLSIPMSHKPQILFQTTSNNSDCLGQVLNPSTGGHQLDSYWNRSNALATFFAQNIGENDCVALGSFSDDLLQPKIYPNPFSDQLILELPEKSTITIYDAHGKIISSFDANAGVSAVATEYFSSGIYLIAIVSQTKSRVFKLVK